MKSNRNWATLASLSGILMGLSVFVLAARAEAPHGKGDSLYIGDAGDNTVKRFNAETGEYLGAFVTEGSGGLDGPKGLIFTLGQLFLVNQNVDQDFAGEILRYRRGTGAFLNPLVPCNPLLSRPCSPDAPFQPRGMVRGFLPTVYVADAGDFSVNHPGRVAQFNAIKGTFIRNLDDPGLTRGFFPRGIVFGPDGLIYVSATGNLPGGDLLSAYILRFNPISGKFMGSVVSCDDGNPCLTDCARDFHRPEGLVFGPDNRLYVTSFRASAEDTDKVLVFDRKTGKCLDEIDLDQVGEPRAFAQALLFGPGGRLFVPITGNGPDTGQVRRYDVGTKQFDVFVPASAAPGPLEAPWYLSFGETDPRTLKYGGR